MLPKKHEAFWCKFLLILCLPVCPLILTPKGIWDTQQDQWVPMKSELDEHGHNGRVLAPIIGRYGGASSDFRKLHEPRARLPVWPGGLCRRRLDGTLSVSY